MPSGAHFSPLMRMTSTPAPTWNRALPSPAAMASGRPPSRDDRGGISREEFEAVRSDVIDRIEETASGILNGRIGINPLKNDSRLACNYCGYRSVCRRDRGYVKNAARRVAPKPPKEKPEEKAGAGD